MYLRHAAATLNIYLIISLGGWEMPEIPGISGLRARNVHGYARVRTSTVCNDTCMWIPIPEFLSRYHMFQASTDDEKS